MDTVSRRPLVRELLVVLGFLGLTAMMTWPWVAHLKTAVSDAGDPYLNSWILWWDFHQTFHAPLHLFDGNIFFPAKLSLAFSEHNYGIALPLFPLFLAGLAPLTVHGIATLLGYALSGYAAFRLARTLTGSTPAAWVAGIAFAFVPYRFHLLPHLNYVWAVWIPLLLEALVLFARKPDRRRAAWLGAAFFFNGLSCIHWLVLTLPPLAVTAGVFAIRMDREERRRFLLRGAAAVAVAGLLLAPFLIPYSAAAKRYGFVRSAGEAETYSAHLVDWLTPDPKIRFWQGYGDRSNPGERCLFPGLLLFVLPFAALLLEPSRPAPDPDTGRAFGARRRLLLVFLDLLAAAAGVVALLSSSPEPFRVTVAGHLLLSASSPMRALLVLIPALLFRWCLRYPPAFTWCREPDLLASLRTARRSDAWTIGVTWAAMGFLGSLGMHGPFHRLLFAAIPLFRAIRVPARWATVADLGLALLAGLAALRLAEAARRRWPSRPLAPGLVFGCLGLAFLVEQRVAPLKIYPGDTDPDALTLRLKETPMAGGVAELPVDEMSLYRYTLRAADHGRPLVTAISGFEPPHAARIRELAAARPIPDELLDLLEGLPTSYLAVHPDRLAGDGREAVCAFLSRSLASGRLRFVRRFPPKDELYALVKNEPQARQEAELPWRLRPATGEHEEPSLLGSVDQPAEAQVVNGTLLVRGWARMPGEDLGVTVLVDGEEREPVSIRRTPRPDVVKVFPEMGDVSAAGYEARFAFQPGDEGTHEIVAVFRGKDGTVRHFPARRFVWRP